MNSFSPPDFFSIRMQRYKKWVNVIQLFSMFSGFILHYTLQHSKCFILTLALFYKEVMFDFFYLNTLNFLKQTTYYFQFLIFKRNCLYNVFTKLIISFILQLFNFCALLFQLFKKIKQLLVHYLSFSPFVLVFQEKKYR